MEGECGTIAVPPGKEPVIRHGATSTYGNLCHCGRMYCLGTLTCPKERSGVLATDERLKAVAADLAIEPAAVNL